MGDLREVVARAFYEAMYAKDGGVWSAVETRDVWLTKADAVLAAIRKDHAIVERPAENVDDATFRQHLIDLMDEKLTGDGPLVFGVGDALDAVRPILIAHARDAALEEAAREAVIVGSLETADRIRALKSGGRDHG